MGQERATGENWDNCNRTIIKKELIEISVNEEVSLTSNNITCLGEMLRTVKLCG